MENAPPTLPPADARAAKPAADRRRKRYQSKPAAPPSFTTRCMVYSGVLLTVAIVLDRVGLTWLADLPVMLSTLPLYCVAAVQLRRVVKLAGSAAKGTEESRREAGVAASAAVRNPRCYALVMLARPLFGISVGGGVAAFVIVALSAFQTVFGYGPQICAATLALLFASFYVAYALVAIALMVLHLFDFIEAQPDNTRTRTGHPMPGTPVSRRWVLGLRRITGLLLYGAFALLLWSAAWAEMDRGLLGLFSGSVAAPLISYDLAHAALLASGALFLAVVPLALLQFVLVATCFCRFSLRSIFLLQAACAALVSLAYKLPSGWNAVPVVVLVCVLTYAFFFVVNQDPESTLLYTPDFIRQRLIQRRALLRERQKAQARLDAQPVSVASAVNADVPQGRDII